MGPFRKSFTPLEPIPKYMVFVHRSISEPRTRNFKAESNPVICPIAVSGCIPIAAMLAPAYHQLVHQVCGWYSGAAAYFGWMREPKRENTRCGLRPMSDKAASQKTRSPEGCDENGPAAALLLRHVSIQICSFVAPCWRPILIATPLNQSRTWCTSNGQTTNPADAWRSKGVKIWRSEPKRNDCQQAI